MGDPFSPRAPQLPHPIPPVSFQGNNIMLVASQAAPQGPERKSYEIVFREVGALQGHTLCDPPHCPAGLGAQL